MNQPVLRIVGLSSALLLGVAVMGVPLSAQTYADAEVSGSFAGFSITAAVDGESIFLGRSDEAPGLPLPPGRSGAVYVFTLAPDGTWSEGPIVQASDSEVGDGFGSALAVAGDWMVVGAPKRRGTSGMAFVFQRSADGQWTEAGRLQLDDVQDVQFGNAVAVADGRVFVGAPQHGDQGAVFVFERTAAGAWRNTTTLTPDAMGDSHFGASLDAGGDRLVVGAPGPTQAALFGAAPTVRPGAAYVFHLDGSDWTAEQRLVAEPEAGSQALGAEVLLDGTTIFAGAPISDVAAGAVYQFDLGASGWSQSARLTAADSQGQSTFGASIARAGEDLLIGAPVEGQLAGAVHVLRQGPEGWAEVQSLNVPTTGLGSFFGLAIAAADDWMVVGAPAAQFFEGIAYAFRRNAAGSWEQVDELIDEGGGFEAITGAEAECSAGRASGFDCADVDLVSFLPVGDLGGGRGIMVNDLWGWTDGESGKEYAIIGRFDGTAFVDVSDAANPRYLGNLALHEGAAANLWRDIKVYADHAFIVADNAGNHGVQIFDLTRLRDVTTPQEFDEDAHYDGIASAHNIVINEETGFAYSVGSSSGGETCGGGLHMIDIRDPKSPTFAGCFSDPLTGNAGTGYSHDAMCTVYHGPDAGYQGHEICFGSNETAISIADVTDKENPVALSRASYPNVAYAHQGWISDDHRFFFTNDEGDEIAGTAPRTRTLVWDIEDLDDPVLLTEYMGETAASDHNLYVKGDFMYESNYVAGLRIIDVSDPAQPREVGYFDTLPAGDNSAGFAGSWSNYPYFESGIILVSSMREGLFILKKTPTRPVS